MAAELKREQDEQKKAAEKKKGGSGKDGGEVVPFDKFQYLVGQSEVFAHFLAGKLYLLVCAYIMVCLFIVGAPCDFGCTSALVYTKTLPYP